MHRRPFVVCLTLASVVLAPAALRAQASRSITVEYEHAPLSRVVESFASFSGRPIALAPGVGDPAVTASVQNVDWQTGLARILAAQSLVARPTAAGGFRIESERRISVEYQDAHLSRVVHEIAAFAGRTIMLMPEAGDPEVTASIQDVDWQRALDGVLAQAGLVARVDRAGAIRVEPRSAR